MEDLKNKLIALWKKLSGGHSRSFPIFGSDAKSDWRVLLACCLILEVILIYAGVYVWRAIERGTIFQVSQVVSVDIETLDREALNKVIEIYNAREQQLSRLKNQAVTVKDPSI